MSTGLNCLFVERKPKEWVYILEDGSAPKNADDWVTHYSTTTGPFQELETAIQHLDDNHANPGGWSEYPFDPARPISPRLAAACDKATLPRRGRAWRTYP